MAEYKKCYGKCDRMIKQIPAADVEPVIRCKDCEHSKELLDYDGRNLYCLVWG